MPPFFRQQFGKQWFSNHLNFLPPGFCSCHYLTTFGSPTVRARNPPIRGRIRNADRRAKGQIRRCVPARCVQNRRGFECGAVSLPQSLWSSVLCWKIANSSRCYSCIFHLSGLCLISRLLTSSHRHPTFPYCFGLRFCPISILATHTCTHTFTPARQLAIDSPLKCVYCNECTREAKEMGAPNLVFVGVQPGRFIFNIEVIVLILSFIAFLCFVFFV
jgi:hypothetical protein